MLESINVTTIENRAEAWFFSNVWTGDTLLQLLIIAIAFAAAALVHRLAAPHLTRLINMQQSPAHLKRLMHSLRRLLFAFVALLIIFCVRVVDAVTNILPSTGDVTDAAMSLLIAWIVVRLAVQVVSSHFMRNIFTAVIWIIAALSILGIRDETVAAMDALGMNLGSFRLSALTLTKGTFAIFALLYIAGFLSTTVEKRIMTVSDLTPTSRVLIGKVTRITLIVAALLIGVASSGIDLSLLAVFSGALGLGIGFGLQKGTSNLFSGVLLLLDKSIKPGDIIELKDGTVSTFGWVRHMGARYIEIITRDNKSFLIPNEDFITQRVVNWSHGDTLVRLETKFAVDYKADPHQVKALAEAAAQKPDRVVSSPAPVCHLLEFDPGGLKFTLRFWIRDAEQGVTNMHGAVMLALWDTFRENGIRLPYPYQEVTIVRMPEPAGN